MTGWISRETDYIHPNAMIGYCSGETNALFASDAWQDMQAMLNEIEKSRIYSHDLAGTFNVANNTDWRVYRLSCSVEKISTLLEEYENCYLSIINTPNDCVIAGPIHECKKLLSTIDTNSIKPMNYNMVIHCQLVDSIQQSWYDIHNRKTVTTPIRHYSCASGKGYYPTRESAANALLQQATHRVDFPRVIHQAWEDGIRIFIEHGPRHLCSQWIDEILREKPHLAISFDNQSLPADHQAACVAASLLVNNIEVNYPNIINMANLKEDSSPLYKAHWPNATIKEKRLAALQNYRQAMQDLIENTKTHHTLTVKEKPILFNREDLIHHASSNISKLFGEKFIQQDHYEHQVRMPEPPLLLTDKVISLTGEAGSMQLGKVVTETDVTEDAWYVHENHMPAGIMIEAGQSDLFIISWLGIDFLNKGECVYRLLGCELTYYNELPTVGDILHYEIDVDGHTQDGDLRLFFFHYDCTINDYLRLKVRHGQAGFFTEEELRQTKGVIWDAKTAEYRKDVKLDPPVVSPDKSNYSKQEIKIFSDGDLYRCFGQGFELAATHNKTPKIATDNMLLFDVIEQFDIHGGPWQRGYCRASLAISPNHWFFAGHFKNDPCMPGTLMFEGCLQVMAFYLSALGYTLDKDGWRFEPIPDKPYPLRCRAQATPNSKYLIYEIFIEEQIENPTSQLIADVLVSVDGVKAFHARGLGLQLTQDYPLSRNRKLPTNPLSEIISKDNFNYDYQAMLHFSTGQPSKALGKLYLPFDKGRHVARMPGTPYNFMHGVTDLQAEANCMTTDCQVTIAFQVPKTAWYFQDNPAGTMPFCVLLEIALQPCGWLASYVGCPLHSSDVLRFRNLDGQAKVIHDVYPDSETIYTTTKLIKLSEYQGVFILEFEVNCQQNNKIIFTTTTSFGFFPEEAFDNQPGLSANDDEKKLLSEQSNYQCNLHQHKLSLLARNQLLMLDEITTFWPNKAIPQLRAIKYIDPYEWFFKAHFYSDPVQPGSLGLEAILQLIQFYMIESKLVSQVKDPIFTSIGLNHTFDWQYRGQVIPTNQVVTVLMEITNTEILDNQISAFANASLWADNKKIYATHNFKMTCTSR